MVKAIRFDKAGGPEVMKWVDIEVGEPGTGEIRIRQTAVGLNYIDVYFRTGLYPLPLPTSTGFTQWTSRPRLGALMPPKGLVLLAAAFNFVANVAATFCFSRWSMISARCSRRPRIARSTE